MKYYLLFEFYYSMEQFRLETENADKEKKRQDAAKLNISYGYGGKFGVQTDRMDKSAVGHDYQGKVEKHASQKDYTTGFGGKFGIQKDRVDKSAAGWDHFEKVDKHASQKDYSSGFGGKFGLQTDRVDKSALGWDYIEKVEKHESQKGLHLIISRFLFLVLLDYKVIIYLQIIQKDLVVNLACRMIVKTNPLWVGITKKNHKNMKAKWIIKRYNLIIG